MRYLFAAAIAFFAPAYLYSQNATPAQAASPLSKVTFVDHDKVRAALAAGGTLVSASDVLVQGAHREKPGQVEVHDKEMDVIYVIDGTATFVTGGTIVGAKSVRPGQWLGTDVTGGAAQTLVRGDVIVVPAGTPHWFKEVPTAVSYYVVKVVKP